MDAKKFQRVFATDQRVHAFARAFQEYVRENLWRMNDVFADKENLEELATKSYPPDEPRSSETDSEEQQHTKMAEMRGKVQAARASFSARVSRSNSLSGPRSSNNNSL